MRCKKSRKLLITYIINELKAAKREKLEEHLASCSDCSSELEALRGLWDLLDVSENIDVPGHLAQKVASQAASLVDVKVESQWRWYALQWSLMGAVLTLVCCILALLFLDPSTKPEMSYQAGDVKIGFYLAEHEKATQYVSFQTVSSTPSKSRWIPMNREDMFYYDGLEGGDSGVFLRGQEGRRNSFQDKNAKPAITEGKIITFSEAEKLMPFSVAAPETLGSNYKFEFVVKINGKECVQIVYSDGARTLSLFQQHVWAENGIRRRDFQEYILHKAKGGSQNAVLGWITKETAFNLVGEVGFSELMQLAEEIQEKIATDKLQDFYEKLYGE